MNPSVSLETNKANLLALEQKHLDWLFSLPESLRYNFNPTAGSSLGYTHTPETLVKISKALSGENNPMYGRTGAHHPTYGKVAANAMTIDVYDLDNVLVRSFTSKVAAANWLNTSRHTVSRYMESGKVWNKLYTFQNSS